MGILTRPETGSLAAHAKIQPEQSTQDAKLLLGTGSAKGIAGLVQNVDGQSDLTLLGIGQSDGHPCRLHHTLILQQNAELGRIIGQLDKVDFDLLDNISFGDRYVNDTRDIREALRLDDAIGGAMAVDAVCKAVWSSHGGLCSRGGEVGAGSSRGSRRGGRWARYTPIKVAPTVRGGGRLRRCLGWREEDAKAYGVDARQASVNATVELRDARRPRWSWRPDRPAR